MVDPRFLAADGVNESNEVLPVSQEPVYVDRADLDGRPSHQSDIDTVSGELALNVLLALLLGDDLGILLERDHFLLGLSGPPDLADILGPRGRLYLKLEEFVEGR